MTTLEKLSRGRDMIRRYGLRTCAFRARYLVSKKTGRLKRRFPAYAWIDRPISHWIRDDVPRRPRDYVDHRRNHGGRFFFDPEKLPALPESWHAELLGEANAVVDGKIRYFSAHQGPMQAAEHWFRNPFTGQAADRSRHWCDREDLGSTEGDIKFIWEPGRFTWAFALVRAYAATGDETYPRTFWRLYESWRDANPPQMGPHWQCGQECSFRLFALCFAIYAFDRAPSSTDSKLSDLAAVIAAHAERIDGNIEFALSQKNNHGVSEAAGLYTAGVLFPEFRRADHWRARGKQLLEREGLRQIYADGSYVQHSMNYQRLMLHDYLWALRLAELNDDEFSEPLRERLAGAATFLHQMQDETSGRVPNYGPNDGSLILPLANCDYLDYRPALQAMHLTLHDKRVYEPGPWDELSLWLFGKRLADAPLDPVVRSSASFADGGYDVIRGAESWAMVRCHTYRDRPAEADMLHLDLWWRGLNVLRDGGTYSYNCPPPWDHYFRSTAAHNTVVVDGLDQMTKGPRFLWFDWVESARFDQPDSDDSAQWIGEHHGYLKRCGVTHRRTIQRRDESTWEIIDDLSGDGRHEYALHWHTVDAPFEFDEAEMTLRLDTSAGPVRIRVKTEGAEQSAGEVLSGIERDDGVHGWESLYYGVKQPRPAFRVVASGSCPIRFVTAIVLGRPHREPAGIDGGA